MEALLEVELEEPLGYSKHDPAGHGSGNARNGSASKTVRGDFTEKIVSLYARGMTIREIEEHLRQQIIEWQNRPLERLYAIGYVDGLRVPVRTEKDVIKNASTPCLAFLCGSRKSKEPASGSKSSMN